MNQSNESDDSSSEKSYEVVSDNSLMSKFSPANSTKSLVDDNSNSSVDESPKSSSKKPLFTLRQQNENKI